MSIIHPGDLKEFYAKYYPVKRLVRLLGSEFQSLDDLSKREFSFTLQNGAYLRFQSFNSAGELCKRLVDECPVKIDIGAIYTSKPSERKLNTALFKPIVRELVFDIDLSDYDDTRRCCQGKSICTSCWAFMIVGVRILDTILLRKQIILFVLGDFGFRHRLWVFSGRRGVHCWIFDKAAKSLSNGERKALLSCIEMQFKNSKGNAMISHPMLRDCFDLTEYPHQLNEVARYCMSNEMAQMIIGSIEDREMRDKFTQLWAKDVDSAKGKLLKLAWNQSKFSTSLRAEFLQVFYPRLDGNVSIQLNHLLKRKLCVPLDLNKLSDFDPNSVPTLPQLCSEDGPQIIAPYIEILDNLIRSLEAENTSRSSMMDEKSEAF